MDDRTTPNDSGLSTSIWMREAVPLFDTALPRELRVDVCVIGAGIVGLSTAYHLTRGGLRVAVIDDGPIGGGETGRTTAHLATALDDRYAHLERVHGARGAQLAAQSHAAAIDDIEAIVARHRIACQLRRVDGYLFASPSQPRDQAMAEMERELVAAGRAGLDVELMPRPPLPGIDSPCLRFPHQAQFHPIAYLRGLAMAIVEQGGWIHTGVRAEEIEPGPRKEAPSRVRTDGGQVIEADFVVVATNAPITSRVAMPLRQAAYRSYVIAAPVPTGAIPPGLYWDNEDPYHYVRLADGGAAGDLLIVGGEDHRTGQEDAPQERWERLRRWTRNHFPMAGEPVARWSGQILEPADGLAFIGRSGDDNLFIATGDSGNGITHGALAGILLTDLIVGRPNPWATLYDPKRSSLRGIGSLLREAASSTAQYADWLSGGDVKDVRAIAPGAGAVVRQGLHLIAVYRDPAGACHARSAVCTHLGGVVSWNAAEGSWDCPCHGSRFDPMGRVIDGPANSDLPVVELEADTDADADNRPPRPRSGTGIAPGVAIR
jgi:glycine/D-amino acid oxidase-like deaminating enzyme/nitrite reductase/ring-hydroxylating ferredoxin subunit